jgi:ABC-type nitrate/sulfonate/bicarbonate transport system substrate-binding protein
MSLTQLTVLYGHLEGTAGKFARDPSGYLSLEAGIFLRHGLEVSWQHVQGTEERYRRLEGGSAQVSLVVGRASLQHFLVRRTTRILGCAMNSCSYYLMTDPAIKEIRDLKGKTVVCREGPTRNVPLVETFQARGQLRLGADITLQLPDSDQEAFSLLVDGRVPAALLPRPFGFWAEERGFKRVADWPDVVDDPLPISIETTATTLRDREKDLSLYLQAHREGIGYLKTHRAETLRMLQERFGHSSGFAGKTFDDYLVCMDETLTVDFKQLEKLLSQVAPETPGGARQLALEWIAPGGLKE